MNDYFMHNLRAAVDRLVPSYTVAHNARGNQLVESGDYNDAIAEFDEAIRFTPSIAEIYSDRGRAHAVKGNIALALADYDEAIRLRPQEADFYTNRGAARRMAGDDVARPLLRAADHVVAAAESQGYAHAGDS